jgi:hypothetical protein
MKTSTPPREPTELPPPVAAPVPVAAPGAPALPAPGKPAAAAEQPASDVRRAWLSVTGIDLKARRIMGRDIVADTEWQFSYAPDINVRRNRPRAGREAAAKPDPVESSTSLTSRAAAKPDPAESSTAPTSRDQLIKLDELMKKEEFPVRWGGRVIVSWRDGGEAGHLQAVELAPEEDPEDLSENDYDPTTKKTIKTFILGDNGFIVYLDEDYSVHCSSGAKDPKYPKDSGEVFNRVTYLETLSIPFGEEKKSSVSPLIPMRRLLGEAVARMISVGRADAANDLLDKAEAYLNARRAELARIWYLSAAAAVAALPAACALVLWPLREWFISGLGIGKVAFTVALSGCFGGIGAFMFVLGRSDSVHMEAGAGRRIHRVEAGARVLAGIAGGVVASLALQAPILAGLSTKLDHPLALMLLFGLAAGSSERLVPNLVGQAEARAGIKGNDPGAKSGAGADARIESDLAPHGKQPDSQGPGRHGQRRLPGDRAPHAS